MDARKTARRAAAIFGAIVLGAGAVWLVLRHATEEEPSAFRRESAAPGGPGNGSPATGSTPLETPRLEPSSKGSSEHAAQEPESEGLYVRVRARGGEPVPGAIVEALEEQAVLELCRAGRLRELEPPAPGAPRPGSIPGRHSALTGPDGSASLPVDPAFAWVLAAGKPGFLPHAVRFASNPAPGAVELFLEPALHAGGTVVAPDATEVRAAAVELEPQDRSASVDSAAKRLERVLELGAVELLPAALVDLWTALPRRTRTNEYGRFRFEGLRPGALYVVRARVPGFPAAIACGVTGGEEDLRLMLEYGGALEGRVLFEDGMPAANVRVTAVPLGPLENRAMSLEPPSPQFSGAAQTTSSDARGRYRIAGLAPGLHYVVLSGEEVAREVFEGIRVEPRRTARVDFTVARGLEIRGTVQEKDGTPVAGAGVRITRPESDDPARTTESDAEGRFGFAGLPPGRYLLAVVPRPPYAPSRPLAVTAGETQLSITLSEGRFVAGEVRAAEDGRPLEGAQVRALGEHGEAVRTSKTLKDGSFVLDGLPETISAVEAVYPARLRVTVEYLETHLSAADADRVLLELPQAGMVAGRVVSEAGTIVGPARVSLRVRAAAGKLRSFVLGPFAADPAGRFFFRAAGAPAGGRCVLRARVPGYLPGVSGTFPVPAGPQVQEVPPITVLPGGRVRGRVTGPRGPVRGVVVRLVKSSRGRPEETPWYAITTIDGEYEIPGVEEGEYHLEADPPDLAPFKSERFRVFRGGIASFNFLLDEGASIEGRVLTPAGEPLSGVRAAAFDTAGKGRRTVSDQNGFFHLKGLAPFRRYIVVLRRHGFAGLREEVRLAKGTRPMQFVLEPLTTLEARAYDAETGEPPPALTASLDPLESTRAQAGALQKRLRPAENGLFQIEDVPPGRYRLEVRASGYLPAVLEVDTAQPERAEIALLRGGSVELHVRDGLRNPVPGVEAVAETAEEPVKRGLAPRKRVLEWTRNVTDESGTVVLSGLPDGRYRIRCRHPRALEALSDIVEVTSGRAQPPRIDVVLEPGFTLEGRALDAQGEPLAGAEVVASGGGVTQRARAGKSGGFRFEGLSPGRYKVIVLPKGGLPIGPVEVEVTPEAQPALVTIRAR